MSGPCAKARVTCTIKAVDGQEFVGENACENPQEKCPRLPGEGYDKCQSICRQEGHAEVVAVRLAGVHAHGGSAVLRGHTYVCNDCETALLNAGVRNIEVAQ